MSVYACLYNFDIYINTHSHTHVYAQVYAQVYANLMHLSTHMPTHMSTHMSTHRYPAGANEGSSAVMSCASGTIECLTFASVGKVVSKHMSEHMSNQAHVGAQV